MISMISHENREERKKKRNEKSVRSSSSSSHFIDSCVPERNRGTRFTLLDIPFREPSPPSLSLLIHLQLAISRRRHGIRQCSHDAKCNSNAVSVPVLRASGWGGGAGRGVEQRSLLIAAPILEHGRPEMEKSCREWTSRLLASAGFRGSVERTDRGKARPRLVIRVPGSSTIVFTWIPVQSVVSAVPGHGSHR